MRCSRFDPTNVSTRSSARQAHHRTLDATTTHRNALGHLGDCNPAMLLGAIGGVEAALVAQGLAVGGGGVGRAVLSLAGR